MISILSTDKDGDRISMATDTDLSQALSLTDGKLQLQIEGKNIADWPLKVTSSL